MDKYINANDWSYDSTITQAKFINISDVLSYFNGLYGKNKSVDRMIEKLETDLINTLCADVVEVKHGEWLNSYRILEFPFECSVCGEVAYEESNFCPNCGADMRNETELEQRRKHILNTVDKRLDEICEALSGERKKLNDK